VDLKTRVGYRDKDKGLEEGEGVERRARVRRARVRRRALRRTQRRQFDPNDGDLSPTRNPALRSGQQ
jgi:hypothetical protein